MYNPMEQPDKDKSFFRPNYPHNSEIQEYKVSFRRNHQVPGMRVTMEKPVFKNLFEVRVEADPRYSYRIDAHISDLINIRNFGPCNKLHGEHTPAAAIPVDLWETDPFNTFEIFSETVCIPSILNEIKFFSYLTSKVLDYSCRVINT